jgi:cytochrome P450
MSTQPPGPKGVPLFGTSQRFARDPFAFLRSCADAYGDVVRFDLGPNETYLLTNPADIERVLVSEANQYTKPQLDDAMDDLLGDGLLLSDGDQWRKQRDLANPAFRMQRLGGFDETMTDYTDEMLDGWRDGETFDVQSEMARLTLRIIVDVMLGVELDDERTTTIQECLEPLGARFEPDPRRFLIPNWVPTRENREFYDAVETLEGIVDDIVAERRGTEDNPAGEGEPPMDLLSILLRAQGRGEQTKQELRDEMITMLLAGHDTTALTLTYTWYLLSQNPEVEAKLHAELDEVLGGRTPTTDDLRDLQYTEQVMLEAMRIYPPVYMLFREPKTDVKLGGYRIPEGSMLLLSQWVTHRSPRFYENPEAFDPSRWDPERRSERPRFSYFPFGGGQRHCIGKQLSLMEGKLILGTVAQQFSLAYARDDELDLRGSLTMHPKEAVEMTARGRES